MNAPTQLAARTAVLPAGTAALPTVLPSTVWRAREAAHHRRVDALTADHRARKSRGEKHPIEDFLWTYYTFSPGELKRWHPGADAALADASDRKGWRYYEMSDDDVASLDLEAYFVKRGATVNYIEQLLSSTIERTPQFGCFGLHEWAMVYRLTPEQIRHAGLPLRIGHEATNAVVESNPISCSHFDAYRFFTPEAAPFNKLSPTRENQRETEQSACLHAGMDVYKWAGKLGPVIPSELLIDAFELARDIRVVDMQASPYDVRGFTDHSGTPLEPIAIETPEGKREYVRRQREFAERGNVLRQLVLDAIAIARAHAGVSAR